MRLIPCTDRSSFDKRKITEVLNERIGLLSPIENGIGKHKPTYRYEPAR
jgi:hypothetical protein